MLWPDHPTLSRVHVWNQLRRYLCRGCHPLNVALGSSYFSVIYIISCFSSLLHFKLAIAAMVYYMFVLIACVFSPHHTQCVFWINFTTSIQIRTSISVKSPCSCQKKKRERKQYMEIPTDSTHLMHFWQRQIGVKLTHFRQKYRFRLTQGNVWCILWSRKTKWEASCHTSAVWTW